MENEKKLKLLPLGEQNFKKIIEKNLLYVDKTKDIYNLLATQGTYFFLSRPRRFGKTLLISTLEEIFSGNKELFRGLYIYDKIEWKKYPIIIIDFNSLNYTHGSEGFERSLTNKIISISESYKVNIKGDSYKELFENLIIELSKIDKVVILIDEYDKPIVEVIENIELTRTNRVILKSFYEIIKSSDEYIKFAFLTGVSKFSKTSVFSSLNNLKDLTLNKNYSTMLGYTQKELELYFEDRIEELSKELDIDYQKTKDILKLWYNGYSWDSENFVYNPFSILNVLDDKMINNYWFKSGTPTFLIKLIKEKDIDIKSLENFEASESLLDSFEIDNIKVESLLFQTGYLTIKSKSIKRLGFTKYYLNYPNVEVKESLLSTILNEFSYNNDSRITLENLADCIEYNNLDKFFDILKYKIFAQIPNEIFINDKEKYYHTIIYLVLTLIGVRIKAEVQTNNGRIDAVIETSKHIYVFEFKMNYNPHVPLEKGEFKGDSYEKFLLEKKPIYLIGVSFDSENKNIKDWKAEIINN